MLDRLPTEAVIACIQNLRLDQDIQCLQVSKAWHRALVSACIYRKVSVDSPAQFKKMIAFFKKHQDYGEQVKDLEITGVKINVSTYISLPSLFPNVQVFYIDISITDDCFFNIPSTEWNRKDAVQEFKRWKNTITSVTEIGSPICTHALLNRTPCKNLVHLYLGLYGDVEKITDRSKFIAKLKQAPNLTHLFIDYTQLTMKDFEKLLNNAPNLKTLICKDVSFTLSRILEKEIGAPSHLETLMISGGGYGGNALSVVRWLSYFGTKLIHLKNFIHNQTPEELKREEGMFGSFEKALGKCLSSMKELEYLRTHAFELKPSVFQDLDKGGIRLKRLDIGHRFIGDMYKALCESDQIKYLEHMSSTGDPVHCLEETFRGPDETYPAKNHNFLKKLAEFPNLKYLRILHDQEEVQEPNIIPFETMMKYLPKKMETLEMDFGTFVIEQDSDEPVPTTLKTLRLMQFTIDAPNKYKRKEGETYDEKKSRQALTGEYLKKILPNTHVLLEDWVEELDDEANQEFYF